MVRITMILRRTPVIKFRKGGLGQSSAAGAPAAVPAASSPASSSASCVFSRTQPAATMSTCSIPDIDLPLKYRRTPLSQEEIDKINGGGVI
ncbi:unnamed protein product [Arctia plantaginis]|uniref:Mitochondrial ribosomal protein S36 n=1 Tax=Arctia plantaginis TaxID=874455 RepID=A0A8S1BP84_ARCPL|nr:unnamed protein product [Arctia plantaginis]CAB3261558.1 unnamed protein product [Arctia plantaginis]